MELTRKLLKTFDIKPEKDFVIPQSMTMGDKTAITKKKIYPNNPCPCGSGKKYKKCCMNK